MSFGYTQLAGETQRGVIFNGNLEISDSTITDSTLVRGHLILKTSGVVNVSALCSLSMRTCFAAGNVIARGVTRVFGSTILGDLTIHSSSATLRGSEFSATLRGSDVRSIIVKKKEGAAFQCVFLDGASEVRGDIIFEEGNGRVVFSPGAIVHGAILGGVAVDAKDYW